MNGDGLILAGGCVHDKNSQWVCPKKLEIAAIPIEDVSEIVITIVPQTGDPIEHRYTPDEVDAAFFTLASVDKFVVPYYTVVDGFDNAQSLRDDILAYLGGSTSAA